MTALGIAIESGALAPSEALAGRGAALREQLMATRRQTALLCEPLQLEDYGVQSMPDASPVRWHLAHTTWFFETFVLARAEPYRPGWDKLWNSYYESVGPRHPRPERGLLTRPTTAEVWAYREAIEREIAQLLAEPARLSQELLDRIELGIHHEQQHQELILTDLQHALSRNPLRPAYCPALAPVDCEPATGAANDEAEAWLKHAGGVHAIGTVGAAFAFDNERPKHKLYLEPFEIAAQPVTAGAYLQFMADGGYERPELWLSEGWALVNEQGWRAPLYWEQSGDALGSWRRFSLYGLVPIDEGAPVCHVSYFEADAFARWAGLRLPTESEWELVAAAQAAATGVRGQFVEAGLFTPIARASSSLFGAIWQWTQSPYTPYPGFVAPQGALGEYNAKFMINQLVLRGGSCFTPQSHIRATYRNFFPASARWQMSGFRLAR